MTSSASWDHVAMTTPSFAEYYRTGLSPHLQETVAAKFALMAKRFAAEPRLLGEAYDEVEYLDASAYELDVNRRWRGIACVRDDVLALYAVGDHNMIPRERFTQKDLAKADDEVLIPFAQVVCESALDAANSAGRRQLDDALESRWLYTLDRSQDKVLEKLVEPLFDAEARPVSALVSGGPGTGKTALLVQIADLCDWDKDTVALHVSNRVADFLASGLGDKVRRCRPSNWDRRPVTLVDDPKTWRGIQNSFTLGQHVSTRVVVVATDLAQVENVVEDLELNSYLRAHRINHHQLSRCYRQTKKVGKTAVKFLRFISQRFTKHIDPGNKQIFKQLHKLSVESADDLEFVADGGYSWIYEKATLEDVRRELAAARAQELWTHWYPFALLVGSSRVDLQACKLEYSIVSPK